MAGRDRGGRNLLLLQILSLPLLEVKGRHTIWVSASSLPDRCPSLNEARERDAKRR